MFLSSSITLIHNVNYESNIMNYLMKIGATFALLLGVSSANATITSTAPNSYIYNDTATGVSSWMANITATAAYPDLNESLLSFTLDKVSNVYINAFAFNGLLGPIGITGQIEASRMPTSPYSSFTSYQNLASGTYQLAVQWANLPGLIAPTSFSSMNITTTAIAAVPEPETYALMGVGLLGLLTARRRKTLSAAI